MTRLGTEGLHDRAARTPWRCSVDVVGAQPESMIGIATSLCGYGNTAVRHAMFIVVVLTFSAAPAADQGWEVPLNATAFAGGAMTPDPHVAIGIAVGVRPAIVALPVLMGPWASGFTVCAGSSNFDGHEVEERLHALHQTAAGAMMGQRCGRTAAPEVDTISIEAES